MVRVWTLLFITTMAACATPDATPPENDLAGMPHDTCVEWSVFSAAVPTIPIRNPQDFIRAYNSFPPRSDVVADEVHLWHKDDSGILYFVKDGCVIVRGRLPWDEVEKIIGVEV